MLINLNDLYEIFNPWTYQNANLGNPANTSKFIASIQANSNTKDSLEISNFFRTDNCFVKDLVYPEVTSKEISIFSNGSEQKIPVLLEKSKNVNITFYVDETYELWRKFNLCLKADFLTMFQITVMQLSSNCIFIPAVLTLNNCLLRQIEGIKHSSDNLSEPVFTASFFVESITIENKQEFQTAKYIGGKIKSLL